MNKDLYDESSILKEFDESLLFSLPDIQRIDSLKLLEEFLSQNEGKWFISPFSKAQLFLLSSYLGKDVNVLPLLSQVCDKINHAHPLKKEVLKFRNLLTSEEKNTVSDYCEELISANQTKLNLYFSS